MGSLGTFGRTPEPPKEEEEKETWTFTYFTAEIRVETDYNQIRLVNFMEAARNIDETDPMALVIVKDLCRVLIDGRDFNTFWKLAEQNKQQLEDLVAVVEGLTVALTGHPTRQPSDSSAGRLETSQNVQADSPTPVSLGRPDLQILQDGAAVSRKAMAAKVASL